MKLKDKVSIVTGAARGIGFAIASRFAVEGSKVVVIDLYEDGVKEAVNNIKEQGGVALGFQGDVTSKERVEEIVSQILKELGTIDVLVNNAGIYVGKAFWEEPLDFYERTFKVNVLGTVIPSQAVVPHMMEKRKGKIINISSKAAICGEPGHAAYSASKGAVLSLTRAMAIELASYRINVNALCPGPTETAILFSSMTREQLDELRNSIPLGRYGKPEDIAGAALYLASDDSDWCTGHALSVDGGMSILK